MNAAESPTHASPAIRVSLAVVVPVYGNWADTLDCLGMLAGQTTGDFKLYLADDGSLEPPPEAVNAFPFVTYLRRPHKGFAATCNAAVDVAAADGCTHVLLLNNDTSFGPGFIEAWLPKVAAFPQAIMAPVIHYFDAPETIWYSGGRRSIAVPFFRLRRRFAEQTGADVLTGCVLLVPVAAWKRLDGFDERYVTYYEDFDFMLRARESGVQAYVVVEPSLRVLHKVSRTTLGNGRWNREYSMIPSRLRLIRSRFSGFERATCLCLAFPHLVWTAVTNLPELPNPGRLWLAVREGLSADTSGWPIRPSGSA